jgi:hypothetical protein
MINHQKCKHPKKFEFKNNQPNQLKNNQIEWYQNHVKHHQN